MTYIPVHLFATPPPARAGDRRLAGAALTVLIHLALILGWRTARNLPPAQSEESHSTIQWIQLPALLPHTKPMPDAPPSDNRTHPHLAPGRSAQPGRAVIPTAPAPGAAAAPKGLDPAEGPTFSAEAITKPTAETLIERARRAAGGIDRTLRKENRPYIAAPPDSPQIRMRSYMEQAHDLAPSRLWEAPKVEELVNNTGDGARRTRVITGNGTYCVTERSPATSVDMIEKHGKLRLTTCPQHEEPAKQQRWRTVAD
jgi:hypothetical protein